MTIAKPRPVDTPEGRRLPDENDPRHGTLPGYRAGCRCDNCRKAQAVRNAVYQAANREAIAKQKAAYYSDPAVREARTAAQRARYADDSAYRQAHSERNQARRSDPAVREARIAAQRARYADDPEYRQARYERQRAWLQDPAVREARAAAQRARYASSPAVRDARRAKSQDPAVREADTAAKRARYANDPAYRERVAATKRARRKDPAVRQAWAAASLAYRQTPQGRATVRANSAARREWEGQGTATGTDFAMVLAAANGSCTYCRRLVGEEHLDIDHVVPRALGGANDPDNLAAACRPCNRGPGGKCAEDPWTWIARTGASTPDAPALHRYPKPAGWATAP